MVSYVSAYYFQFIAFLASFCTFKLVKWFFAKRKQTNLLSLHLNTYKGTLKESAQLGKYKMQHLGSGKITSPEAPTKCS